MEARNNLRIMILRGGRSALQLHVPGWLLRVLMLLWLVVPATTSAFVSKNLYPRPDLGARLFALSPGEFAAQMIRHGWKPFFEVVPSSRYTQPPPPPRVPVPVPETDLALQTPEDRRGRLRVYSLHLEEELDVVPFDPQGRPDPRVFSQIAYLWRCRFTGHEVPVDPKLIRILTLLNDIYDKPIHMVSGHRTPDTVGTSKTSQHTLGTAADIRIPGVPVRTLQKVVTELGARGVGLYTHKDFVHVDFRKSKKYFWVYTDDDYAAEAQIARADLR